MLRRVLPFILIAFLVLACLGVFVAQKVSLAWLAGEHLPCDEVWEAAGFVPSVLTAAIDALQHYIHQAGKAVDVTKKNQCDFLVQSSDQEQTRINRLEGIKVKDRCAEVLSLVLDRLKEQHAETLQDRIEVCDAAAVDPDAKLARAQLVIRLEPSTPPKEFDYESCKALTLALSHNVPPDRTYKVFELHHTKKTYCELLTAFSDSERGIIDRFANFDCHGYLEGLKWRYAKTLDRRTKACNAAAIDPDGLVTSYSK